MCHPHRRSGMSTRRLTVSTDLDLSGTVAAFLFGGVVGLALVYPALPGRFQALEPGLFSVAVGGAVAPLLGGVLLFVLVVLGVVFLNWLFIRTEE